MNFIIGRRHMKENKKLHTELDNALDWLCHDMKIPGLQLGVYKNGEQVYMGARGYMDDSGQKPVNGDTIFRLFSMTKLVTAVAGLQLYEKGKFLMDDPVSRYLPEYEEMLVQARELNGMVTEKKAQNRIRIRDLFMMTAGFAYDFGAKPLQELDQKTGHTYTTRQFAEKIAEVPLLFEPGTRYNYSFCFDVLGALIEVLSGQTLGEYMNENIFRPLGMSDTFFKVPEEERGRVMTSFFYDPGSKQHFPFVIPDFIAYVDTGVNYESGGAGLYSTMDDYAKFVNALCMAGGLSGDSGILNARTVDLMRTNHLGAVQMQDFKTAHPFCAGYGYGLGVRTLTDPAEGESMSTAGEFGWSGFGGTYTLIDPDQGITIVYLQQMVPNLEETVHRRIRNIVFGNIA